MTDERRLGSIELVRHLRPRPVREGNAYLRAGAHVKRVTEKSRNREGISWNTGMCPSFDGATVPGYGLCRGAPTSRARSCRDFPDSGTSSYLWMDGHPH